MAPLRKRADVAFVEPDYVAHQIATPNDPEYSNQWGLHKINASAAWDVQTGGALVAVIDAGIDLDHPDLVDRLWTNTGKNADGVGNDDNDIPFYPAAYDSVLAVAGTDTDDVRVHNSNYGDWVDLSAPGEDVVTKFSDGTYGEADGTSLAAPFVSGVAALLKVEHGWTPAQVHAHLMQTADPIDGANPGYEGQLGAGRLDAGAALNTAAEPDLEVQAITVDGKSGGQPEPGTTVDLQIALTNNWAPVGTLQGTLTSNDSYATIAQNSASFEPVGTYSTTQNSTPFQITIAGDAPYGHELDLRLRLNQGGTTVQNIPVRIKVAQQTINVSGIISADTTWSGDRVYRLTGNVRVQAGATLTVEPGARVEAEGDRILEVEGKLVATGTKIAPIVFTSGEAEPTSWSWRGLDVSENGLLQLAHCEVAYAGTGINIQSSSQMHTIDDCDIHHNSTGVQTGWDGSGVNTVRSGKASKLLPPGAPRKYG